MKKILLFASAAALVATSCSDDLGFKTQNGPLAEGNFEVLASYPMGEGSDAETRTTLGNNATKSYQWNDGDAIGVFPKTNGTTINAMFRFSQSSGQQASFKGDMEAVDGTLCFGYYPYNQFSTINSDNTLTMGIAANQNYNHKAATDWTITNYSGSFSNGAAPAVAFGTANNGQLELAFRPLASYLVFPIVNAQAGNVKITNLTLTAKDKDGNDLPLAGTFDVQLTNLAETSGDWVKDYEIDVNDNTAYKITLNCGQGVTLATGEATNFWFVVPAGMKFAGSTLTLNVEAKVPGYNNPVTRTLTKVIAPVANPTAGANKVWMITPATNTPWAFTSGPTFVIQNQAQFIEYAYLLTYGKNAILDYVNFRQNGGNVNYSSLPDMLTYMGAYDIDDVTTNPAYVGAYVSGVKDAVIASNLDFIPANLSQSLGMTVSETSGSYYQKVYLNYVNGKGIPTIGGGYFTTANGGQHDVTPTISGNVTLNNLPISGLTLATGNVENVLTFSGMTFTNLKVAGPSQVNGNTFYPLLYNRSNPTWYVKFNGVTIGTGCDFAKNIAANKKGLFAYDYSSFNNFGWNANYTQIVNINNTTNVNNNSGLLFANVVNINNSKANGSEGTFWVYDFSAAGRTPSSFNTVNLMENTAADGQLGYGALLKVATGENYAVELMEAIVKGKNTTTPYSIVDGYQGTSYWTGRNYAYTTTWYVPGTAEFLATMVQNQSGPIGNTYQGVPEYDIDLMGTYTNGKGEVAHSYWWNNAATVNIGGGKLSNGTVVPLNITNVYLAGVKPGANGTLVSTEINAPSAQTNGFNYFTLVGDHSNVKYLNLDNVQVVPNAKATGKLVVGAVSTMNIPNSNSIAVTNMNVEVADVTTFNNVLGGMYFRLTDADLQKMSANPVAGLTSVSLVPEVSGVSGMNMAGYLAGELNYTIEETKEVLYNPYSGVASSRQPFGKFNLYIKPNSDFTSSTLDVSSYAYYNAETVMDINITPATGATLNQAYKVQIVTKDKTYQWSYNKNLKKFEFESSWAN